MSARLTTLTTTQPARSWTNCSVSVLVRTAKVRKLHEHHALHPLSRVAKKNCWEHAVTCHEMSFSSTALSVWKRKASLITPRPQGVQNAPMVCAVEAASDQRSHLDLHRAWFDSWPCGLDDERRIIIILACTRCANV